MRRIREEVVEEKEDSIALLLI